MSGGSYNYVCFAELDNLVNSDEDLQNIADRLQELDYGKEAAKETQRIIKEISQFREKITVKMEELRPVWREVEWWDSLDSNEKEVKKVINKWKNDKINLVEGNHLKGKGGKK